MEKLRCKARRGCEINIMWYCPKSVGAINFKLADDRANAVVCVAEVNK